MARRFFWLMAWLVSAWMAVATPAQAADKPVYTGIFSDVALRGHDAVAYFTEHRPVKGDARFSYAYQGAKWQFVSAANRDAFAASPARYAPQYGGYCAWAVAQGGTASADPALWKIVNDKLYLNFDAEVQKKWERDIPGFIVKADQNWPSVLGK